MEELGYPEAASPHRISRKSALLRKNAITRKNGRPRRDLAQSRNETVTWVTFSVRSKSQVSSNLIANLDSGGLGHLLLEGLG
jgi:hypothetical protein